MKPAPVPPARPVARLLALVLLGTLVPALAPVPAPAAPGRGDRSTVLLGVASVSVLGDDPEVAVVVRPAQRGARVRLQVRRPGTAWTTVDRARQDRRGRVALRVPPTDRLGLLHVRAVARHRGPGGPYRSRPVPTRVTPEHTTIPLLEGARIYGVDVSADGRIVAANASYPDPEGGSTGLSHVYDRLTGTATTLPKPEGGSLAGLPQVASSGRYVAHTTVVPQPMSAAAYVVRVTDLETGRTVQVPGRDDPSTADVSPDGRYVVYAADRTSAACPSRVRWSSKVTLYDTVTGRYRCLTGPLQEGAHDNRVGRPRFTVDGSAVVFPYEWREVPNGPWGERLVVWRGDTGPRLVPVPPGQDRTTSVSDDLRTAVTFRERDETGGAITRYDTRSGRVEEISRRWEVGAFPGARLSVDGRYTYFRSGSDDVAPVPDSQQHCVYRHDAVTDEARYVMCDTEQDTFSGDGSTGVWSLRDGTVRVRQLAR